MYLLIVVPLIHFMQKKEITISASVCKCSHLKGTTNRTSHVEHLNFL